MVSKNKFGFEVAVRETAENLSEATEAKVEQRRQNAADAKEYREALSAGRVLVTLPLEEGLAAVYGAVAAFGRDRRGSLQHDYCADL